MYSFAQLVKAQRLLCEVVAALHQALWFHVNDETGRDPLPISVRNSASEPTTSNQVFALEQLSIHNGTNAQSGEDKSGVASRAEPKRCGVVETRGRKGGFHTYIHPIEGMEIRREKVLKS